MPFSPSVERVGYQKGHSIGRVMGRDEGRREGREQGRKEGRELGRKEGREQGRKEGREEGLREGRHLEALALVYRQLGQRFGALSQETEDRIAILPLARIEALAQSLLDFASPQDLDAWLERR